MNIGAVRPVKGQARTQNNSPSAQPGIPGYAECLSTPRLTSRLDAPHARLVEAHRRDPQFKLISPVLLFEKIRIDMGCPELVLTLPTIVGPYLWTFQWFKYINKFLATPTSTFGKSLSSVSHMALTSNQKRAQWRQKCREALARHICTVALIGVSIRLLTFRIQIINFSWRCRQIKSACSHQQTMVMRGPSASRRDTYLILTSATGPSVSTRPSVTRSVAPSRPYGRQL